MAHPVEVVVVRHQRAVIGESGRLDQLESLRPERPVRGAETDRRGTRHRPHGLHGTTQDLTCLIDAELGEVLVEPAVTGELVAAGDDRLGVVGERRQRVAGNEEGGRDRAAGQQLQEPLRPDPRAEFGVAELDRRVAPPDRVGDRVVVDRQGD